MARVVCTRADDFVRDMTRWRYSRHVKTVEFPGIAQRWVSQPLHYHERSRPLADTVLCKVCADSAMQAFHRQECKLFSEDSSMPAKYRALCRILLQRTHGLLSDQMWQALCKMESHYEARMSKQGSKEIQDVALAAKSTTSSRESLECIANIYCIVSHFPIMTVPGTSKICLMAVLLILLLSFSCSRITSAYGNLDSQRFSGRLSTS